MTDDNIKIKITLDDQATGKTENIKKGIQNIASESKKANTATSSFLDNIGSKLSASSEKAAEMQKRFESITTAGKAMSLVFGGISLSLGFVGKLFAGAAMEFENQTIALETMIGSAKKAKDLLKEINQMAVKTPFEYKDLVEYSKILVAAGIEVKNITPLIKILGDVAAGVGTEKMPFIVNAFRDIVTKGRLTGEELRQLGSTPLLGQLATDLGTSKANIRALSEQGKISSQDVVNAFYNMTASGGIFYNMSAKQAQTTSGKISNLKDAIFILSQSFGKFLLPAIREVADFLKYFIDKLNSLSPEAKKAIGIIGMLVAGIAGLGTVVGIASFSIGSLVTALGVATGAVSALGAAFGVEMAAITALAPEITLAATLIGILGAAIYKNWEKISNAVNQFKIGDKLDDAISSIKKGFIDSMIFVLNKMIWIADKWNSLPALVAPRIDTSSIKSAIKELKEIESSIGKGSGVSDGNPKAPKKGGAKKDEGPPQLETEVPSAENLTDQKQKQQELNDSTREYIELLRAQIQLGEISYSEEKTRLESLLADEALTYEQRKALRLELNEVEKQLAIEKQQRDDYLNSNEINYKKNLQKEQKKGVTAELQLSKVILDSARKSGDEKLNIAEQIANGTLDHYKKLAIAEVDLFANKLIVEGTAHLISLNPVGLVEIAAGVAASAGIRAAASSIKLAEGGVVMPRPGGVQATIGEAGKPEAVIPLNDPRAANIFGGDSARSNTSREVIILTDDGTQLAKGIYKKQTELLNSGQLSKRT